MGFHHVLVATDFGDCSTRAIETAIELARRYNAELTVIHVFEPPTYFYGGAFVLAQSGLEDLARTELDGAVEKIHARYPQARSALRCGTVWHEVLDEAAKSGADLLVVGSHGRRGVGRALLGSVAEKLVRLSTVPVLTVHGGAPDMTQSVNDQEHAPAFGPRPGS